MVAIDSISRLCGFGAAFQTRLANLPQLPLAHPVSLVDLSPRCATWRYQTHTHTQSNTYDIHKRGKPRPNSNSAEFLFPNYKWTIGRRRGVTGTISPRLPDRRKRSHAIRIEPGLAGLLDHAIAQFAVANRGATEASWELPNLSSDLVSWHTFQANMCQPIVHGELPQSHYVCSVLWISCWLERLMARSPS